MGETEADAGAMDGRNQLGECHGGPWDAKSAVSRFPKGFLLVDKQANKAWIYDWNGLAFVCREPEGRELEFERRFEAAHSLEWDVIAFAEGDDE